MDAIPRSARNSPPSWRLTWKEIRERSKARFAAELRGRYRLRLHVVVMLCGAVLAGALASALALAMGMHAMPWRYLLGLGVAYMTFLGLVRLWIAYVSGWRPDADPDDVSDCFDLCSDSYDACLNPGRAFDAGGGHFGGGGAGGSWGDACQTANASDSGSGGFGLDLDDGILLLPFAAALLACLGGVIYVVAVGPGMLTEAAFEVVLASVLARRTARTAPVASGWWLNRAVRSTVLPFLIVAAFATTFAWLAQDLCPAALRLRDVVECISR